MAEDRSYNGFRNYETWLVSFWIDNDQSQQEYWQEQSQDAYSDARAREHATRKEDAKYHLADALKGWHEEQAEEFNGIGGTVFLDLITSALSEVDWDQIAENMLEECESWESTESEVQS
jgi:hypothetical protein